MALKIFNALVTANGFVQLKKNYYYALRKGPAFDTDIAAVEMVEPYQGRYVFDIDYSKYYKLWSGSSAGTAIEDRSFHGSSDEGVLLIAEDIMKSWHVMNFFGSATMGFKATTPMILSNYAETNSNASGGTGGTFTFQKALSASPTVFNDVTFPITLAAGDIFRVKNTGYSSGERSLTLDRGF
jgi:hypothetical protein